jgi:hypothetical protein
MRGAGAQRGPPPVPLDEELVLPALEDVAPPCPDELVLPALEDVATVVAALLDAAAPPCPEELVLPALEDVATVVAALLDDAAPPCPEELALVCPARLVPPWPAPEALCDAAAAPVAPAPVEVASPVSVQTSEVHPAPAASAIHVAHRVPSILMAAPPA